MEDLKARLRRSADMAGQRWPDTDAIYEAADRIEALEALLREATNYVVCADFSEVAIDDFMARIDALLREGGECNWPSGSCKCWEAEQSKPDPWGRVWMHCEEGLSMSKASLARFLTFCLSRNVEIGSVSAFQPSYSRSIVLAAVRLKPDQFAEFEMETGGKLRAPPKIKLNSDDA